MTATQVSHLQQQLSVSSEAGRQVEELKAANLGMEQEAHELQQDNDDLVEKHDAAQEQVCCIAAMTPMGSKEMKTYSYRDYFHTTYYKVTKGFIEDWSGLYC